MVSISFSAFDKEYTFNVIKKGRKVTTIRKPRKKPIKQGDRLQLYWKMRTKECEKIADADCVGIERIELIPKYKGVFYKSYGYIWTPVPEDIFKKLWNDDGFECEQDFWDYFTDEGYYDVIRWNLKNNRFINP